MFVLLSVFCYIWACCVLLDNFFCVCPIVCQSVCVLTLGIWYPCKKMSVHQHCFPYFVWHKSLQYLTFCCLTSVILIFRKGQDYCFSYGYARIRQYCLLSLSLIAGFALTFSIHYWTTITDSRGAD